MTGAASDVHPFLRGTTMTGLQRPTLPRPPRCTSHVERLTGPDIFEYSREPYYVILFDTGGNEAGRRKDPAVRGSAGDARGGRQHTVARGDDGAGVPSGCWRAMPHPFTGSTARLDFLARTSSNSIVEPNLAPSLFAVEAGRPKESVVRASGSLGMERSTLWAPASPKARWRR